MKLYISSALSLSLSLIPFPALGLKYLSPRPWDTDAKFAYSQKVKNDIF